MLRDIEKLAYGYFKPNQAHVFCLSTICRIYNDYRLEGTHTTIRGIFSLHDGKKVVKKGKEIIEATLKHYKKSNMKWVKNQVGRNIWIQTLRQLQTDTEKMYEIDIIISTELSYYRNFKLVQ